MKMVSQDSPPPSTERSGDRGTTRKNVAVLLGIFSASLLLLAVVLGNFPHLDEEDLANLRFPRSLDAAKDLGRLLSKYKDTHYFTVLGGVATTYVFLQTFAIPGSIFFSILSGFLFPFSLALFLVCTCSALGATFCYFLSSLVGRGLMRKHFPQRLQSWQAQVAGHHDNMLWYIIFLRITPFLPNWFINLASPVIGVKLLPFFFGTVPISRSMECMMTALDTSDTITLSPKDPQRSHNNPAIYQQLSTSSDEGAQGSEAERGGKRSNTSPDLKPPLTAATETATTSNKRSSLTVEKPRRRKSSVETVMEPPQRRRSRRRGSLVLQFAQATSDKSMHVPSLLGRYQVGSLACSSGITSIAELHELILHSPRNNEGTNYKLSYEIEPQ